MEMALIIILIVATATAVVAATAQREVVRRIVSEHEWVLEYRKGSFSRILEPGRYWYWKGEISHVAFDRRLVTTVVPNQDLLTKDNLGIKVSAIVTYRIVDPRKLMSALAIDSPYHLAHWLHQAAQLHLRDAVVTRSLDEIMDGRAMIGAAALEALAGEAARHGVEVSAFTIRDIMLAAELKRAFAAVAMAQKEGMAKLEQARGEMAALRSLANAARLLKGNPELAALRLLQGLEAPDAARHTLMVDLKDMTGRPRGEDESPPSAPARRTRTARKAAGEEGG